MISQEDLKEYTEATVNVNLIIDAMDKAGFEIGEKVIYQDEEHVITDVDEGYKYLALGGDRYITPDHEDNNCVSAPMCECIKVI